MYKIFISALLLVVATLISSPPGLAQTANKVIDRHRKATGGSNADRIKSTLMSGSVKTAEGATGTFVYRASSPDRLRVDIEMAGARLSECYNGKSAWRMDGRGLRTLLGPEAKRLRLEAMLANSRLRNLSRNRIATEPPVRAEAEGREVLAVGFIRDDVRARLFFDPASGLLVKQERETAGGTEEVFYADYRPVGKVMEPHAIRIRNALGEMSVTIDRVEHNKEADEAAFRYPQIEGAQPLPDLEALLKSVIANEEKTDELREQYTYRSTEKERKEEGGMMRAGDTKVYEVTPVAGGFVRRLVSVNGKTLSPAELEKEDRRVRKEVEELVKARERQIKKENQGRADGDKKRDDDDDLTILDFLRISEITSVRREKFRGQEVIAFDFEPKRGFKPKNRGESFASKLAGTMWVDERAHQVARVEARLTDSFKIGGGLLASVSPSSAVVIEQEKIGDEIWLPSYTEVNLTAKLFLFAKMRRNFVRHYSDYRKYQVDSRYDLDKPKEAGRPDKQ